MSVMSILTDVVEEWLDESESSPAPVRRRDGLLSDAGSSVVGSGAGSGVDCDASKWNYEKMMQVSAVPTHIQT